MKYSLLFLGILLFLATNNVCANEPNWYLNLKKISPIVSSRTDVEKTFNSPPVIRSFTHEGIDYIIYATKDGELNVQYSTGICAITESGAYEVTKGIVLRAIFFPKISTKLSELDFKRNLYIKSQDPHDLVWHYVSTDLGINFSTKKDMVLDIVLFPSSDHKARKCDPSES